MRAMLKSGLRRGIGIAVALGLLLAPVAPMLTAYPFTPIAVVHADGGGGDSGDSGGFSGDASDYGGNSFGGPGDSAAGFGGFSGDASDFGGNSFGSPGDSDEGVGDEGVGDEGHFGPSTAAGHTAAGAQSAGLAADATATGDFESAVAHSNAAAHSFAAAAQAAAGVAAAEGAAAAAAAAEMNAAAAQDAAQAAAAQANAAEAEAQAAQSRAAALEAAMAARSAEEALAEALAAVAGPTLAFGIVNAIAMIASFFGGPLAGLAVSVIAEAFGIPNFGLSLSLSTGTVSSSNNVGVGGITGFALGVFGYSSLDQALGDLGISFSSGISASESENEAWQGGGGEGGSGSGEEGAEGGGASSGGSGGGSVPPGAEVIRVSRTIIRPGESVVIVWQALAGGTACTGINFNTGGAPLGSISVAPLTTTTFVLSCNDGTESSLTVFVLLPEPEITSDSPVRPGSSCTVRWDIANASSCTLESGTPEDGLPANISLPTGSHRSPPLTEDRTYTVSCSEGGATAATSTTCRVRAVPVFTPL